ncbi:MAG: hypothetical protein ACPGVG_19300, partial [Mycobacterium sp.]
AASGTVAQLLGLFSDNPNTAGISTRDLPGYTLTNGKRELGGHSKAVAGEALSSFADSLHGSVSTVAPKDGIRLKGNIGGASIQVASAPDAKVSAVHEFSGQQRTVSRLAMMPESTRYLVLGVVPFGRGDK